MRRRLPEILLVFSAVVLIVVMILYPFKQERQIPVLDGELPEAVVPQVAYGIVVDSLDVIKGKIRPNQFLAEILLDFNVDYRVIDRIAGDSKKVFDVRKLRAGNTYAVITPRDSLAAPLYFIYEISPVDYVVYPLGDTLNIFRGAKKIDRRVTSATGSIETSLWNSMADNHTDPNLANEMSEIFAWAIDFFGLQRDDSYKVLYEELYVEDRYVGLGRVLAACIDHMGNDHYAFYFVQDSVGDYFDDAGGSMRRTFLKAPLRFRRISSRYSHSRMHPVLKIRRPHRGVDYAAASGTPVHSVGEGIVTFRGWKGQGGRMVKIKHNGTYGTAYLHLSAYGNGITVGARVKQGQVIGYVGASGLATGPHLDFRFYRNGRPIDPLKVKSPPAKPVDSAYFDEYMRHKDSLMVVLRDSI
ncbi:MAG: peptidoglycan DD-metalloendopeptidase family protein [Bacteroidales bacterium]